MAVVILSFTVLALAVAVFALYRMVAGLNVPLGNQADRWPFGGLMAGHDASDFLGTPRDYSGFVLLCTDDLDALGAVFSTSVIADEWHVQLVIAQTLSNQPSGWLGRASALTDFNASVTEVAPESLALMRPDDLPICVYLHEGRVLEASARVDSPSLIASHFTHVVSHRPRRSLSWQSSHADASLRGAAPQSPG